MEIKNALITGTFLGYEDHGIFTFWIDVNISGGGCVGIGTYALDEYSPDEGRRVFKGHGLEPIARILDTVGADSWEKLKGEYIRIKSGGWGTTVDEIGNLMDDKWFNIKEYFSELQASFGGQS